MSTLKYIHLYSWIFIITLELWMLITPPPGPRGGRAPPPAPSSGGSRDPPPPPARDPPRGDDRQTTTEVTRTRRQDPTPQGPHAHGSHTPQGALPCSDIYIYIYIHIYIHIYIYIYIYIYGLVPKTLLHFGSETMAYVLTTLRLRSVYVPQCFFKEFVF